MTRDDALSRARQPGIAIRDIPRNCTCGDWQYYTQPARWVLQRPRAGCPWHLSRERQL
jgi:hypothetical protein